MNIKEILDLHGKWLRGEEGGVRADFYNADLRYANLSNADLRYADLRYANLSNADLSNADLRYANLSNADLSNADLSNVDGLLDAIDYLSEHFEKTDEGFIAYKTFGGQYEPPKKWKIEPGSEIRESVNFDRCCDCGCGINVAPIAWVKNHYSGDIWKVLIRYEWLAGVCVPYHTDGKIRCERVQLLEIVKHNERSFWF